VEVCTWSQLHVSKHSATAAVCVCVCVCGCDWENIRTAEQTNVSVCLYMRVCYVTGGG